MGGNVSKADGEPTPTDVVCAVSAQVEGDVAENTVADEEKITLGSDTRDTYALYYTTNRGSAAREHAAVTATLELLPTDSPARFALERTAETLRQIMLREAAGAT